MKRTKLWLAVLVSFSPLFFVNLVFSQPPSSQTIGGVSKQEKDIEKKKKIEKQIESPRVQEKAVSSGEVIPVDSGPRVLIRTIKVEGATLLSQAEIQAVISQYEGKELTFREMQKVADLITDEFRKKGYATSRAYIPPQNVREGTLIIRVIEGKVGKVQIEGNKYFKTQLLEKKLALPPAGNFDYSALQRALVYINEHPDRTARATLMPGKEAGTTDVLIKVEDKLPIHAGFEYDNYGSRYISKNRYSLFLEDNNLLGFDDKLYLKAQMTEADHLKLYQGRYSFPILEGLDVGAYFVDSALKLGKEFKDLDARGDASIYGLFMTKSLINKSDLDLRYNLGFDYKRIKNYLSGTQSSRDSLRVLKTGFDLDVNDIWGRNVILPEINMGFADILGAMEDKDPNASRAGAGAEFTKGLLSYYRLQALPWETTLLWKNSAQYTNNNLCAVEQFQIGGATSVRGYPPAEKFGDRGLYSSPELSFPIYFLPQDWKVPYNQEKLYDTSRLVIFYDWGTVRLRNPQAGEKKSDTLRGWGFGYRFNLRDNLSFRVELGYPLGKKTPSDARHAHPWVEFTSKF
ncbi:MAG: ShlB/FhaC/HecB family hemolysin secretion/activation protein [Candidatus Omnitrophota bacterium]